MQREEESQPLFGGLANKIGALSALAGETVNQALGQVNKIVEDTVGDDRARQREELIKKIHECQQSYIVMLLVQFFLTLAAGLALIILNNLEIIQDIPFMVIFISIIVYILCLAMTQLGGDMVKKNPKNVFLFIVTSLIRLVWVGYLAVQLKDFHFLEAISILFFNSIIILIFFKLDQKDKIKNCFLIKTQPWRLTIILLIELLIVGIHLQVNDFGTAILWALIIVICYFYCLLSIQLVEFRTYLQIEGNVWFLCIALFDSDIIFPCFFFEHHCTCLKPYDSSILKD